MTAKEFLSLARNIDRRIDAEQERLDRMRSRLETGRMSHLSGMPRGGRYDWADTESSIIDLEKRLNAQIRDMCRIKIAVTDAIRAVGNVEYEEVLNYRYLDGLKWERIAEIMGYELRNIHYMHGKALLRIRVPNEFA